LEGRRVKGERGVDKGRVDGNMSMLPYQNKTKQNKTKQNRTEQNRTKQNRTEQNKTKQNKKTCNSLGKISSKN